MHRRDLLKAGLAAAVASLLPTRLATADKPAADRLGDLDMRLCVFTDHVDDLGFSVADVAKQYGQLGVGPDLTVRGGGVVAPERVAEDLPKAATAFADHGLRIPMLSTSINDLDDPVARPTLEAMGRLGIRHYKLGYAHYHGVETWEADLQEFATRLRTLETVGRRLGITAGIHNHSGQTIGGPLWDLSLLLDAVDSPAVCSYFDPAHATLEGANFGWKIGFHRLKPRIGMLAVKDFEWVKQGGQWRTRWCPLGEGIVRWPEVCDMLAKTDFSGPISVHIEYGIEGNTRVERFDNCLAAAKRDLECIRRELQRAYGAARA